MSCRRTDAIRRHLLSGNELGRDDARHVATCAECRRAVTEVERLDGRLRQATAHLAAEPIPPEALDLDDPPLPRPAFGMPAVAGLAAVAVLIAGVLLATGRAPVAVAPGPSGSASPSPSASASATPSATPVPTPSLIPAPTPPPVDAHLVGPGEACMDGTAGFGVRLPDGWYANRHLGSEPACRTVGTVREVEGHQNLDPVIYLSVADAPPELDPSTVTADTEIQLPDGATVRRLELHAPESGALAAIDEVRYLATLRDQRTLVASTDSRDAAAVSALAEVMATLVFTDPIFIEPAVVAEAEALFADRDVCVDPERGLSVVFPDAWWTNTAVDDLPACSWFAPSSFEYVSAEEVPEEVEIVVEIRRDSFGWVYEDPTSWDSITLFDRPGTRYVVGDAYAYSVQLGDLPDQGPTFSASTGADPLSRAVLDQLMARMSFSTPPPGAESDLPDIAAPPAAAEGEANGLRLELTVDQERYRAGQPILADTTLTYLGPDGSIRIWGSSMGPVFTGVRQLDGPIDPGGASTTDCVARELIRGEPLREALSKSGGFADDDPLADFYRAYFDDALLRLPPGRWRITATAAGTLGGEDCGAGPGLDLSVSVEIVVEP